MHSTFSVRAKTMPALIIGVGDQPVLLTWCSSNCTALRPR